MEDNALWKIAQKSDIWDYVDMNIFYNLAKKHIISWKRKENKTLSLDVDKIVYGI
ncbi:MAG: hypothetical protein ACD_49C00086G0001 [uncultured bacterium (gcode 4)]|uniref:Uncharacterized protein n=1 Tax=uncultured bacterium (gcode 4) TaxID=1234023 RepID=K2ACR9_9BACT|nr:MAG: hypothetical protein ACD_49C00086G0001 [uncultured bacterium (gcode 4)]